MKIGILQADSVLAQFQPDHGDYPGMIELILSNAAGQLGQSLSCETYNVVRGQYPVSTSDCDGYVITGSKQSVYDGDEWITRLSDYIQVLHVEKRPLVGICFGHQLIADALGGKTEGARVGWGVGCHGYEIVDKHWCMTPDMAEYSVLVSHRDQVMKLPEGAKLLAASDFCPNAMYSIEDHIFALQGHPEFRKEYSEDLINYRRKMIGEDVYHAGLASLRNDLQTPELALWMVRFLKRNQSV